MTTYIFYYSSPFGKITLASNGTELTGLWFEGQKYYEATVSGEVTVLNKAADMGECEEKVLPIFEQTVRWLDIYFAGDIPDFTPPLAVSGSEFRKKVWGILLDIPYGKTMTYGEIADEIARLSGVEKMSAQAVGGAVGHNPISLIIPCHRVLGANGKLTGYAGGVWRKIELLKLESVH